MISCSLDTDQKQEKMSGDRRSGESDDELMELPNPGEVIAAKERNPMMFVSGFEADDDGIVPPENPDDPGEKLLVAAENGDLKSLEELLKMDPQLVKYKDSDGYTALHRASYSEKPDAAQLLIRSGADYEACSGEGWRPLHSAAAWNNPLCVRLLLDCGANINALTNGGISPLHLACANGDARETLIILLSEPNINLTIQTKANETAQQIARRSGKLEYLFERFCPSISRI